jgi:hypothetical protein
VFQSHLLYDGMVGLHCFQSHSHDLSHSSIQICIVLVFTQTAGYMLADVMTDALIVERSRYETQHTRGTMQESRIYHSLLW